MTPIQRKAARRERRILRTARREGRPTDYSPQVARAICEQIAQGKSLRKICEQPGMPHICSVLTWEQKHPEFSEQYETARQRQADHFADELNDIADETPANPAATAKARHRTDVRKWIASKLKPKRWGDSMAHQVSGPDGGPIQHKVELSFVTPSKGK